MSQAKNRVWAKFFSFAIVFAFVLSSALMSVGSEPQTGDSAPSVVQPVPPYVPGTEWVKDGVVLDVGPAGEEKHVTTPCVLSLPDGTYAMWYQALGNDGHQRIMKAVSGDGLSWTRIGIALNYGEQYAESGVMFPFVMVDDSGMYHMWYSGYNYKWRAILHADSPDGITWTKRGPELFYGSSFDLDGVASPRVHYDGTQWHMWYSGVLWYPDRDTICHAHKATLSDPWIKDGTVLSNDGENDNPIAWSPFVLPTETGYDMFYGGRSPAQYPGRICHAHSGDGLEWTKTGIAVDQTLPGESYMTDFPSVIYENGEYRMWYVGYDGINSRIYHASAESAQASSVDLSIASEDISLSSAAPAAGETVTVTANVQGDRTAPEGWVKHGVVLDADAMGEDLRLANPCVLPMQNGSYVMYYTAKANDGASTSLYWRIYRAFSYDGITWERQGIVLNYGGAYAGNAVYNPCVWIAPDGTYHMWYAGQNYESGNRARILHATSPDGFDFVYDRLEINFGSSIEPAGVGYPFVMSGDTGFRMWYTGIAWSPLRNWINHAHKSNLSDAWVKDGTVLPNTGQYDNPLANQAWVLASDGCYEMFYTGYDSSGVYRILKATSADGTGWTKEGIVMEPSLPDESAGIMGCSVVKEGDTYKMWYGGWDGAKMRILYAEKGPAHTGLDATCDVSFYLDSQDPANLIGSVENVFVPADGETPVSIDWTAVAGEHEIIVVVSDVDPTDCDLSNNVASVSISVIGTGVDLAIYGDDIVLPSPIALGDLVAIDATIHNLGESQSTWEKQGVILSPGSSVQYPYVIKDGSIYKMWYTGYGATYDIYYATSLDHINWTSYGKVLTHPTGTTYAAAPSVIKEADGTYKMWYSCQNYNWNSEIYYATSMDGVSWTQLGKVLPIGPAGSFDAVYACQGYVLKDAGMYKMYYKAYDSDLISRFGLATSPDGIAWTKYGAVMETPAGYAAMECPFVLPSGDGSYDMWFSTGKILKTHSADGIAWDPAAVALDVTPGGQDSRALYTQCVLFDAGNCYMYYSGDSGSTSYIFLAEMVPAGQDATCTASFYLDSQDPICLIGSVENVFVPAGGEAQVSMNWTAVEGEHEIIVVVSDTLPADSDLSNNVASAFISVCSPAGAALEVTKVRLSGPEQGFTHTYYEWELLITVRNSGETAADSVMVYDVLPAELELLDYNASAGEVGTEVPGTRSTLPVNQIYPVRSTHIYWAVGGIAPGGSETLYLRVCTRLNPAGKQEFTSAGTYIINEGAYAVGYDATTGAETVSEPAPAITVVIDEMAPIIGLPPLPRPDNWFAVMCLKPEARLRWVQCDFCLA